MKKRLLSLGVAASFFSISANAQLALENFNHGGALPTGWTLINDGHTVSTSFTSLTALQDSLDVNAWFPWRTTASSTDYQMITTSYFAPAATADRWLITPSFSVTSPYTVLQWDDYDLNSGEALNIKLSPTAGTTAGSFTTTLYGAPAAVNALTTHQVRLGSYNGAGSITIAFRDSVHDGWGLVIDNVQTKVIDSLDAGVTAVYLPPFVQTGSSNTITGVLHNYGYNTLNSLHLNYSVNGGSAVSTTLSSLTVDLGADYTYTSGTPWVPATSGTYTIKVWADNLNGGVDQTHTNDTVSATVLVIDTLQPKRVLIEEFTQASCDPCANAHTNVDSVYANNMGHSSILRYHVNFPGRDCMDSVTLTPFVSARLSYYGVGGVPDAQVDGQYVYPGAGYFTSGVINSAKSFGSPFSITMSTSFVTSTQTYSFTANVKAHGPISAGLKAYAVLVEDTLTYAANQSTESIPQTIFPQVAEAMFNGPSGVTLSAFTTGSTQTVTGTWVKNHPWGSDRAVWSYDSTATGKIIVWIENDAMQYVYQAAEATVYTARTAGVNAVTGTNGALDIYPNPANNEATVALKLNTEADVKLEVYNTLGQVVYSMPSVHRNAGNSSSTINVSNFAAGEYFVKVFIGNESLTKTLVVNK